MGGPEGWVREGGQSYPNSWERTGGTVSRPFPETVGARRATAGGSVVSRVLWFLAARGRRWELGTCILGSRALSQHSAETSEESLLLAVCTQHPLPKELPRGEWGSFRLSLGGNDLGAGSSGTPAPWPRVCSHCSILQPAPTSLAVHPTGPECLLPAARGAGQKQARKACCPRAWAEGRAVVGTEQEADPGPGLVYAYLLHDGGHCRSHSRGHAVTGHGGGQGRGHRGPRQGRGHGGRPQLLPHWVSKGR